MTRTITTAAELDTLPVGSVVGSALRGVPAAAIRGDLGWALTDQVGRYSSHAVLAALGAAVVLHDPSAPAPAPSVVPEAAIEAIPVPMPGDLARVTALDPRARITSTFRDAVCALASRWERTDPHPDPEGDGYMPCVAVTAVPRIVWDYLTAALPLLTAAPSATRDEVARLIDPSGWRYFDTGMFPPDHPASTGVVHNSRETADALLARFNITPKEDR